MTASIAEDVVRQELESLPDIMSKNAARQVRAYLKNPRNGKRSCRRELDKDNEETPPDDMHVNETHLAEPQTEDEDKMCEEYELTQIKEKLVIQCVLMNGKIRNTRMCEAQ